MLQCGSVSFVPAQPKWQYCVFRGWNGLKKSPVPAESSKVLKRLRRLQWIGL